MPVGVTEFRRIDDVQELFRRPGLLGLAGHPDGLPDARHIAVQVLVEDDVVRRPHLDVLDVQPAVVLGVQGFRNGEAIGQAGQKLIQDVFEGRGEPEQIIGQELRKFDVRRILAGRLQCPARADDGRGPERETGLDLFVPAHLVIDREAALSLGEDVRVPGRAPVAGPPELPTAVADHHLVGIGRGQVLTAGGGAGGTQTTGHRTGENAWEPPTPQSPDAPI